jgi:hypothetical protein
MESIAKITTAMPYNAIQSKVDSILNTPKELIQDLNIEGDLREKLKISMEQTKRSTMIVTISAESQVSNIISKECIRKPVDDENITNIGNYSPYDCQLLASNAKSQAFGTGRDVKSGVLSCLLYKNVPSFEQTLTNTDILELNIPNSRITSKIEKFNKKINANPDIIIISVELIHRKFKNRRNKDRESLVIEIVCNVESGTNETLIYYIGLINHNDLRHIRKLYSLIQLPSQYETSEAIIDEKNINMVSNTYLTENGFAHLSVKDGEFSTISMAHIACDSYAGLTHNSSRRNVPSKSNTLLHKPQEASALIKEDRTFLIEFTDESKTTIKRVTKIIDASQHFSQNGAYTEPTQFEIKNGLNSFQSSAINEEDCKNWCNSNTDCVGINFMERHLGLDNTEVKQKCTGFKDIPASILRHQGEKSERWKFFSKQKTFNNKYFTHQTVDYVRDLYKTKELPGIYFNNLPNDDKSFIAGIPELYLLQKQIDKLTQSNASNVSQYTNGTEGFRTKESIQDSIDDVKLRYKQIVEDGLLYNPTNIYDVIKNNNVDTAEAQYNDILNAQNNTITLIGILTGVSVCIAAGSIALINR